MTDVIASIIISYFIAKFVHKKIFGNKERIRKIRLFSYDRKTNIGKKDIMANTLNYKNKRISHKINKISKSQIPFKYE